ncbi:Ig-like domain-containing protein [Novipirellula sp. SH528]|uniref:Ig-like domain-containing protein n=1 Tax=Novipirellula sp. SH528 TaxID=3454466 RepID=UPI003FA0E603
MQRLERSPRGHSLDSQSPRRVRSLRRKRSWLTSLRFETLEKRFVLDGLVADLYPLNPYQAKLDGQWQGSMVASDGNVYFGSSTHAHDTAGMFFQLDTATSVVRQIGENISEIVGEDPQSQVPQGKLHSPIVESNGWLYWATHLGNYWSQAVDSYTGSHLVGYQLGSLEAGDPVFRDFGIPRARFTTYSAVGVDPAGEYLWSVATPWAAADRTSTGTHLYRTHIESGAMQDFGSIDPSENGGKAIFTMHVDSRGDAWVTMEGGQDKLFVARAATGTIDTFESALPTMTQHDNPGQPSVYQDATWWRYGQSIDDERFIFTMGDSNAPLAESSGGSLWEFDASKTLDGDLSDAFREIAWIGSSYLGGMDYSDGYVYFVRRSDGSSAEKIDALPDSGEYWDASADTGVRLHLYGIDVNDPSGGVVDWGMITDSDGRVPWRLESVVADQSTHHVYMVGDWVMQETDPIEWRTLRHDGGTSTTYTRYIRGQAMSVVSTSTQPTVLPRISVAASDATASEPAGNGEFTFTRTGDVSEALTVHFTVSGTADPGDDYTSIGSSIVIPSGAMTVSLPVIVLDDDEIENVENVTVALVTDASYDFGSDVTASVSITSDEVIPADPALLGYWNLNESSGALAADSSGNANDATLVGEPVWNSGVVGSGLQFDGIDDFADAGMDASVVGKDGFTVAAWVRTSANRDQVLVQQRSAATYNGEYAIEIKASGQVYFWTFGDFAAGPAATSTQTINDGQWHHVVAVREDNGTMRIYIDGTLDGSAVGASRTLVPINVYFGADRRNRIKYLDGSLDEVQIIDRAVDAEEAFRLANGQLTAIAFNDNASTDEETPVTIDVLANDIAPELPATLTIQSVNTTGTVGQVTQNPDNTFTYDPNDQFNSLGDGEIVTDTFSYTVSDGQGGTDSAEVAVSVQGVNDTPQAVADTATTDKGIAVEIVVLSNDADPDNTDNLRVVGIDSSGLQGTVQLNPNGTITYDPGNAFASLAIGESATESFQYTIDDEHGGSDTAIVTVTILGSNHVSIATDDNVSTNEETPISIAVLSNDGDPGDTLHVESVDVSATVGAVTVNPDDTITYDPVGFLDHLGVGGSIVDSFTYTVVDENGGTDTAVVNVTVTGINDVPVALDDTAITSEDLSVTINVLDNDTDLDRTPSSLFIERVASGLASPVLVTSAPGQPNFLFIAEQEGQIKILNLDTGLVNPTPFLTITDRSYVDGSVRGLLGLAFHPDYETNRLFYVYMTDLNEDSLIRQYQANADGLTADPSSATPILGIPQVDKYHYGGWIGFGPEGFLYIASGDGGPGDDTDQDAQNFTDNLRGKILRIDVDQDGFPSDPTANYAIPTDNPFAAVGDPGADEIWAYGLRNPWRSSFDRLTGDLYIADVGQNAREEVNVQVAGSGGGENYGWRAREGTISNPGVSDPDPANAIDPVYDYLQGFGPSEGYSVTGGYVYRGPIAALQGNYFFADFVTERIWSLRFNGDSAADHDGTNYTDFTDWTDVLVPDVGEINLIVSFGEDVAGNLYVVDYLGEVFRFSAGNVSDQLRVQSVNDSLTLGLVEIQSDGSILYDPNGQFNQLSAGETATDSFVYQISDGNGGFASATVVVTITGVTALPVVSVSVTDSEASEPSNDGELTLTRTGDLSQPLTVHYVVSGTATLDDDYVSIGTSAVIPAGSSSFVLRIDVNDDAFVEAQESVTVTLVSGQGYAIGGNDSATLSIISDDQPDSGSTLVGHWTLDDSAGTTAADISGNQHSGTLVGSPTWTTGVLAGGLEFDGVDDYVDLGTSPAIIGTGGFTVAAWVRTTASKDQVIVQQRGRDYNGQYVFRLTESGNVRFWTFGGSLYGPVVQTTEKVNDGQWHHVVGVRADDGTTSIYIDGVLATSRTGAPRPLASINVYMGADRRGSARYLAGTLDDVRIYSRGLDDQEVAALANSQPIGNSVVAVDDSYSVGEGLSLNIASPGVLSNDQGTALVVTSFDTESLLGVPVTVGTDGSVSYDSAGRFESLGQAETATDTFFYTIDDGQGGSAAAKVDVTVTGVNDAPVAVDDFATTDEAASVVIDVLVGDTDVDSSSLVVDSIDTSNTIGLVVLNPDYTVTYSPNGQFDDLMFGQSAEDLFSYTIRDDHSALSTAQVRVTINGTSVGFNAVDDEATTDEQTPALIDVLQNDGESSSGVTVSQIDSDATRGSVVLHPDGTVTYDPDGQFEYLSSGVTASDSFQYTIFDGQDQTSTATVNVTIVGVNDSPHAADNIASTTEDQFIEINVLADDFDVDQADVLSVESIDTALTKGAVSISPDNTIIYDPVGRYDTLPSGETELDTFSYTVNDGHGGSDTSNVSVTVMGVNDSPLAIAQVFEFGEHDSVFTSRLQASDVDRDDDADSLTYQWQTLPSRGEFVDLGAGYFSFDPAGQFSDVPFGQIAEEILVFRVTDAHGAASESTVTIHVMGANAAPVAQDDVFDSDSESSLLVSADALLANDSDVDQSDMLSVSLSEPFVSELGATLTPQSDNGFRYDPASASQIQSLAIGEVIEDHVTYHVYDSLGASASATVSIRVTKVEATALQFIGGGDYLLTRDPTSDEIVLTRNGQLLAREPVGTDHAFLISGDSGTADSLTIQFSSGDPLPAKGVTWDGKDLGGIDRLSLVGGQLDWMKVFIGADAGSGEVEVGQVGSSPSRIRFQSVESLNTNSEVTHTEISLSNSSDQVQVQAISDKSFLLVGPTLVDLKLKNPIGSLLIDGNGGDDQIEVGGSLYSLDGADLTLQAEQIAIRAPIEMGGGNFTAAGVTFLSERNGPIRTEGGNVLLNHVGDVRIGADIVTKGGSFHSEGGGSLTVTHYAAKILTNGTNGGGDVFVDHLGDVVLHAVTTGGGSVDIESDSNVTLLGQLDMRGGGAEHFRTAGANFTSDRYVILYTGGADAQFDFSESIYLGNQLRTAGGSVQVIGGGTFETSTFGQLVSQGGDIRLSDVADVILRNSVLSAGGEFVSQSESGFFRIDGYLTKIDSSGPLVDGGVSITHAGDVDLFQVITGGGALHLNTNGNVRLHGRVDTNGGGMTSAGNGFTSDNYASIATGGGDLELRHQGVVQVGEAVTTGGGNFLSQGPQSFNTVDTGASLQTNGGAITLDHRGIVLLKGKVVTSGGPWNITLHPTDPQIATTLLESNGNIEFPAGSTVVVDLNGRALSEFSTDPPPVEIPRVVTFKSINGPLPDVTQVVNTHPSDPSITATLILNSATELSLVLTTQQVESVQAASFFQPNVQAPLHNEKLAPDVNHDEAVSALDALIVINTLNTQYDSRMASGESRMSVDVNNDGVITALDALVVVNALGFQTNTDPLALDVQAEAADKVFSQWEDRDNLNEPEEEASDRLAGNFDVTHEISKSQSVDLSEDEPGTHPAMESAGDQIKLLADVVGL